MANPLFEFVVRPFRALLGLEAGGAIALFASGAVALAWANLHPSSYAAAFDWPLHLGAGEAVARFTVRALINDGLMAIFFFVVGMEIKRELVSGSLNSVPRATLPAIAALGGMVVPALVFAAFNVGGPGIAGWGVPMATDIAFAVGVMSLLGSRVPRALVVFVTALAVFDDIGGILVIAFFYGHGLQLGWLAGAAAMVFVLFLLSRLEVSDGLAYLGAGAGLWFTLHEAGIHATLSGVVVGLMIPARPRRPSHEVISELAKHTALLAQRPPDEALESEQVLLIEERLEDIEAPLTRFVHLWHPWVAWGVMPLFALANAGVAFDGFSVAALTSPIALGVGLGLVLGKPAGIFGLTALAVKLKVAPMPGGATHGQLLGAGIVAGIGFTVALFIAALAYPGGEALTQAKAAILVGSGLAGLFGYLWLRAVGPAAQPSP